MVLTRPHPARRQGKAFRTDGHSPVQQYKQGARMTGDSVGLPAIRAARARIADAVRRTPVRVSGSLSRLCGVPVWLKLENHQETGSFKLRGATNAVLSLSSEARGRGLVTVSTGNHG